ncbi:MAG: acyl carrier protein [Candidatus Tectomicrobia bacterium]
MTEKINEVMAQVLAIPVESINADTSPKNVAQWDSLKHMQLILALEEEFGITFPDDTVPNLISHDALHTAIADLTSPA